MATTTHFPWFPCNPTFLYYRVFLNLVFIVRYLLRWCVFHYKTRFYLTQTSENCTQLCEDSPSDFSSPDLRWIESMQVRCTCTSGRCGDHGGIEVDKRTYNNHIRNDKIALAAKAQEQSERAIQDQLDAISTHLTSIVLADDSLPTPPVPGGRLWSKGTWRNQISGEKRDTDSASRLWVIRDLLTRLAEIDSQVDALDDKLTCGLDMLEKSQKVDPKFPLWYLKAEYLQIEMDLSKVTLKEASVASMKGPVKEKMDKIGEKLRSAKAVWAAKLAAAPVSIEKTGVQCSTGIHFPHDIARLSMQYF